MKRKGSLMGKTKKMAGGKCMNKQSMTGAKACTLVLVQKIGAGGTNGALMDGGGPTRTTIRIGNKRSKTIHGPIPPEGQTQSTKTKA